MTSISKRLSRPLTDLVLEPGRFFTDPKNALTWRPFLLATILCGVVAGMCFIPARLHIASLETSPLAAHRQLLAAYMIPAALPLMMLLGIFLSLAILLLIRFTMLHVGSISNYWSIVNQIALVKLGFSTLFLGIVVLAIGAPQYQSGSEIPRSMPSALMLFPSSTGRVAAMLNVIDPFNLWAVALYSVALNKGLGVSRVASLWAGFMVALLPQLFIRLAFG